MIKNAIFVLIAYVTYFACTTGSPHSVSSNEDHFNSEHSSPIYRIKSNRTGTTCIAIRTDGLLEIISKNKFNQTQTAHIFLPEQPEIIGNCSDQTDLETFTMHFRGFALTINFVLATPLAIASSVYRINSTTGTTCILIRTDAILNIKYRNKLDEDTYKDLYLPDYPQLSGDCSESDSESLTMSFDGFTLNMYFKKTPGGERWYISSMELTYSTSNPVFEHIDRPDLDVKLTTPSRTSMFFPTPVGKSYTCDQEQEVLMYAPNKDDKSGHTAKLFLRDLRMQSFMFRESGKWGPPFQCSATGTYRDETAPLAVGTTLAVAVLATISGYGAWRYFKVKKVQYGTME